MKKDVAGKGAGPFSPCARKRYKIHSAMYEQFSSCSEIRFLKAIL